MTFTAALRRRLDRARHGKDAGIALLTVIAMGFIMTSLMLGALAYAVQVSPQARHDQDWNAALAAAQAGVDDYVSRLNKADSYALAVDCDNVAMKGPDAPDNSCSWNVGSATPVGWEDVSPGNPGAGQFHYTPNYQAGSVRLVATGKVRNAYRTLDVRVARGGSTDFLYYTDFEDADPANRVSYPSGASTDCGGDGAAKAKYWYETRSSSNTNKQLHTSPTSTSDRRSCSEIQFAAGDKLDGKVHFNDTPLIGADTSSTHATFTQGFETSDPNCLPSRPQDKGYCYRSTSAGTPNVGPKGMVFVARKELPDNSDQFANYPGCVYYGDTRIRFNSNGTMDVWNTSSAGKTITGPNSGSISCGDSSRMKPTSGSDPRPPASSKQNLPVPNDMVIYVRNTGSSNTCAAGEVVNGTSSGSTSGDVIPQGSGSTEQGVTDVNYWWPGTKTTTSTQTFTVKVSSGKYSWQPGTQDDTSTTSNSSHYTTFDCGQGNVYIEGTVKGRVTVAAENNVVVTGDLLLDGTTKGSDPTGTNIVGLVAGNSVVVYHPVTRTGTGLSSGTTSTNSNQTGVTCSSTVGSVPTTTPGSKTPTTTCTWTKNQNITGGSLDDLSFPNATSSSGARWIYASIQTLQHSFWVQTYNRGNTLGDLSVRGSIAQRWRGAVGTGSGSSASTGYIKDYKYDPRLKFSSPPYFPQWTNATWSAATTGELKPKYVGK